MAKQLDQITVPSIQILNQKVWEDLFNKYLSNVVIVEGGLRFTQTYWYLAHTHGNSTLLHSISSHLYSENNEYAKRLSYTHRLLKSALLESIFSLRESLAGLVNEVFILGKATSKIGSSKRILTEATKRNLTIANYLSDLIAKNSRLDDYLNKFRHPYVHREDLSRLSIQDMTAAMVGAEQPRLNEFITESYETSRWLQGIESSIAKECAMKLQLS